SNGYFYNFLQLNGQINTNGPTSINNAQWWSWRALQALTEAQPILQTINPTLATSTNDAVNKLITRIKTDQASLPQTTTTAYGVTIPQWLPAGSGTDQAATLILGLIPYATSNSDSITSAYIRRLADGIVLMQAGSEANFPFGCILSWQNTWHAYGADQPLALLLAGQFLHDTSYTSKALLMINQFFPWLLNQGMLSSFSVSAANNQFTATAQSAYDQIAYGVRPLVFAAIEAFAETKDPKYSDMAGQLAAWFFGKNVANKPMYSTGNGICFDAISSGANINLNSGAESTIEALLTMERVEQYPEVMAALNKYR
ncbi:MAG TPA: hypothetical protein VFV08_08590, partial [Puia sp.]|nr:hypothetical protein [Puia sp.]